MNRAEVDAYNREAERERIERDRLHDRIADYYKFEKGVYPHPLFLERLRLEDPFMYKALINKEDVPKTVIMWFKERLNC